MKIKHLLLSSCLLLLFGFYYIAPMQTTVSGHTAGGFSVSDGGAATYSIPITVPSGTGGIAPKLSMTYSSQGNNGLMGMGWSLQGLSTISRGNKTLAQDGEVRGVDLTGNDTYSLDGERLVSTFGVYGSHNTEYRTEQNAFIRAKSYGTISGAPEKWVVWTKSGLRMELGFTEDSRVQAQNCPEVLFWLVNKVEDTKGNYYTVTYHENNANGEYYPLRIDYTGNLSAGLSPYNSVEFEYESRLDDMPKYQAGIQMKSSVRLKTINAKDENQLFRQYNVTYETGDYLNASLLTSIQECGADNTCFEATTFHWKEENPFGYQLDNGGQGILDDLTGSQKYVFQGDWNADGKGDMLMYNYTNGSTKFFANGGNSQYLDSTQVDLITKSQITQGSLSPGDFNADGFTDIMYFNPTTRVNRWYRNQANLSLNNLSFTYQENLIPIADIPTGAQPFFGDFNGDGLSDIMVYKSSDGYNRLYINNTTAGGNLSFSQVTNSNLIPALDIDGSKELFPLDFNGDGLTDLLWYDKVAGTNYWIRNQGDNTFAAKVTNPISPSSLSGATRIDFGDWNGDGLVDILWLKENTGATRFFYNKGNITFIEATAANLPASAISGTNIVLAPIDFNGDQISDIVFYNKSNGTNKWYLNNGKCDFSTPLNPAQASTAGYVNPIPAAQIDGGTNLLFGGISDKGILDVFWYNNANGANLLYKSNMETNHVMDEITNGIGTTTMIEYGDLTDNSIYTKQNNAVYPEMDFQARVPVVHKYKMDNGVGGINEMEYCYKGAKVNLQGRGYRGFTQIQVTNMQTMMKETKCYSKDYRYLSAPLEWSETRKADGTLINKTVNDNGLYHFTYPDQPTIHFSFLTEGRSTSYELNGNLIAKQCMRQEFDDFGNATLVVMDHGDGFKDSTINFYDNWVQGEYWHLSRLVRTEVHREVPSMPCVKRVAEFEYDIYSGMLTKEITEPDLSTNERTTKTYIHDAFGNVTESHVEAWNGTEIEDRIVYTTYDAKGRYVTTTSNELGHTETRLYDEVLVLPISVTGPNGRTVTTEYDGFGRVIRSDLPDGNWTTTTYNICQSGDCPLNAKYFVHQQASNAPPAKVYFDLLDREIRSESIGFTGATIYQDKVYNNRGLVEKVSDPYFQGDTPNWTCSEYDDLERETLKILPGGREFATHYNGLWTVSTNANGQTKSILQNAAGRNVQVLDNQSNPLSYGYDQQGNMTSITDPNGNTISTTYDLFGRKIQTTDPDMGTYQYSYNMFNELLTQTDANGDVITMAYDDLGRLIEQTEAERTTTWTYDTAPNAIGDLAMVSTTDGHSQSFTYDNLGRNISVTEVINGEAYTTSTTYDVQGRVATVTYPSGFKIKNVYNQYNYLVEVRNDVSNELYWKAEAINAKGQLLQESFGNGLSTTSASQNVALCCY